VRTARAKRDERDRKPEGLDVVRPRELRVVERCRGRDRTRDLRPDEDCDLVAAAAESRWGRARGIDRRLQPAGLLDALELGGDLFGGVHHHGRLMGLPLEHAVGECVERVGGHLDLPAQNRRRQRRRPGGARGVPRRLGQR
jgi:hypothetical protein